MQISEVNITLIKPQNGLIGFASVVIDNSIFLSSIGIHQKLKGDGYRITYPTKQVGERQIDIFHPISKEAGSAIEQAIVIKMKDVMSKVNDRHHCNDPREPRF